MTLARWATVWVWDHAFAARQQLRYLASNQTPEQYARGGLRPVLLIPGVYEPWQFLRPIGDLLNDLGHPVYLVRELGYNRKPILASAELAIRLLIEQDLREVIIVGHSKGGLIGKQMMLTPSVAKRIDLMIAINSPFSGTRLASFAPGATLRAFSPKDAMLTSLAKNREVNSRIVSVFSRFDPVIPEGSRLDGATNIELPLSGHFRPLDQPTLFDVVARAVEGVSGPE